MFPAAEGVRELPNFLSVLGDDYFLLTVRSIHSMNQPQRRFDVA